MIKSCKLCEYFANELIDKDNFFSREWRCNFLKENDYSITFPSDQYCNDWKLSEKAIKEFREYLND